MPTRPSRLAALAALVAVALGSVAWWPERPAQPPMLGQVAVGRGPLRAGAAVLTWAPGGKIPIAGFTRLRWTEGGRRDPMAVRALVLRTPGCSVAVVSLELLLVPGALQLAVERATRDLALDGLVLTATHTHAGPGGYWENPIGQHVATGPFSRRVFEDLVQVTARAVRAADAAAAPASLAVARGEAPQLARNRHGEGEPVDARLASARITALDGRPIAELVAFPAHATLLGPGNRLISGDWPGAFMRLDASPVLLVQGALGDQSVRMPGGEPATPERYAIALRERDAGLPRGQGDPAPVLGVASATAVLPAPDWGGAPRLLRNLFRNAMRASFPERARVTAVRLGHLLLLAVPAEPVAAVGRRWRERFGADAEVVSLSGDYLGYVETPEHMAARSGETGLTYFGPGLADRLTTALEAATAALAARGESASAGRRARRRPVTEDLPPGP